MPVFHVGILQYFAGGFGGSQHFVLRPIRSCPEQRDERLRAKVRKTDSSALARGVDPVTESLREL